MSKVGLVTVIFNSNNVLEGFFRSLSSQLYKDYHLFIIDNTPSLETDECLASLYKQFPIPGYSHYKSSGNIGIAKGNNIGIKVALEAGCEYVLLLNSDIEFEQNDLLKLMIETADSRNEMLVVPKIFFYDTRKVWMAGGYFKWWLAMGYHVGEWQNDNKKYNREGYCDFSPACFLLVKSSLFNEIGMLDEKYFVYYEDTDFLYRAKQKGHKIFYSPQLKILHKVGSSTGGYDSLFGIYYGNRNRIYFIRKHYGTIKKYTAYFFVLGTRIIKYLKYDKRQRKELLRAIKDGFIMEIN